MDCHSGRGQAHRRQAVPEAHSQAREHHGKIEVVHQRRYFWDEVHERLDQLGNRISLYDRRRIEAAITLKVPRLSQAEHDASIEQVQENFSDYNHKPYRPST